LINDEICRLRDELNKSIADGEDYETIYKISTELDELIAKYYRENKKQGKKKRKLKLFCFSVI